MSKNNVNDLEYTDADFATKKNIPTIDWTNDINDLVYQVNQICSILATSDFFNTFMSVSNCKSSSFNFKNSFKI